MRKVFGLFGFFICTSSWGQLIISTNLSRTIPLQRPLIFEVRIEKGTIGNFSRYQMDVPPGLVVQEVDSKGGTFTFDENKVKIIWVVTPPDPEFALRMKLLPVETEGQGTFTFKYYYMDKDEKREYECQPYQVVMKDTVLPVLYSAPLIPLASKNPDALSSVTVSPEKVNTKDPEMLKQQVKQLKKDSKDAYEVGQREKKKAQATLQEIEEEEKKQAQIEDGEKRQTKQEELTANKQKASEDLAVAERVLTLSKSLESNANEIDRINRSVNPGSFREETKTNTVSATVPSAGGPVYMIQIGAFKESPPVNKYKSFGRVTVEKVNDTYKVLVGNFSSREDAYRKKEELNRSFAGCFVVSYLNGQRTK